MNWLEYTFYGNSIRAWLIAAGVIVVSLLLVGLIRSFLARKLSRAKETATDIDDLVLDLTRRTRIFLLFFPVLFFALRALELPHKADAVLRDIAIVAFLLQAGIWANGLVVYWLTRYKRAKIEHDAGAVTTITAFSVLIKIAVWSIVVLMALDNLGFDVTTLIAGLGIGGVAVALATQNILGDIFASLSIVIDKPFVIGDFIIVGDTLGTVEYVGLKTTRVRSLGGEQIICSNGDLLKSRIRNYKRMAERRVVFGFGVIYQTTREQLEKLPPAVKQIIEAVEQTRFDRAHFKGFGDSSLDFEVVYYVLAPDYNLFMDIQQRINLELVRYFEENGLDFAFPTRTLFVSNVEMPAEE
ncbi:MAG: mechanosensitive ion channel family protein [Thermoanaerobaculia bacterium]